MKLSEKRTSVAPVTVVIPAYNCAAWIGETLESVLRQTLPPQEIIVINDGSTDNTSAILETYRGFIRCIDQTNLGVSAARNAGVTAARGKLIAFLDSDDIWHLEKLSIQMAAFATWPNLVLLGTTAFYWPGREVPDISNGDNAYTAVTWRELVIKNRLVTSSVIVQRDAILRAGPFDTTTQGAEDRDMWIRLAEIGQVGRVEAPLTGYRVVEGSMSRAADRCYQGMRRIVKKLDERGAWKGDSWLRRKALSHIEHSAAYVYAEEGRILRASAMELKSLVLYPMPFAFSETQTKFERPKRLAINMLRLMRIKPSKRHAESAVACDNA